MSAHTEELDAKLIGAKLKEIAGPERRPMGVYSAEDVKDYWLRQAADRIEALEAAGVEVTLTHEHILGAVRFDAGRYRIVKLDGPAPEPEF